MPQLLSDRLVPRPRIGLVVALWCAGASTLAHADVIYVRADAAPGGGGSSWDAALPDLQAALALAVVGDEIRVAAGTYTPDPGGTSRHAAFELRDGVAVLGGFDGTGQDEVRDPAVHVTILSGDLLGDDTPGFGNYADNSYHVVIASGTGPTAVLDGFTIRGGHANGLESPVCFGGSEHGTACDAAGDCPAGACVSPESMGAGVFALGGAATIRRCRIVDNLASFQGGGLLLKAASHAAILDCVIGNNRAGDNGGGLYLGESSPSIVDTVFIGNAGGRYAGGTCNRDHSNAVFINCMFEANTAAESTSTGGGAMVNASSSPVLLACTFRYNEAIEGNGGAIYNKQGFDPAYGVSAPYVQGCLFHDNTAGVAGGATYDIEGSTPLRDGCGFIDNTAPQGGHAYIGDGATPMFNTSQFHGGTARSGGAAYVDQCSPVFTACSMVNNAVDGPGGNEGYGGAIYNVQGQPVFDGCSFTGGQATRYGGVLYSQGADAHPVFNGGQFDGNAAALGGGAFYVSLYSRATVDDATFHGNVANDSLFGGAAVFCLGGSVAMTNCRFHDNQAPGSGAVLNGFVDDNHFELTNCLFHDNIGGTIKIGGLSGTENSVTLINCTIVADVPSVGVSADFCDLTVRNSVFRNSVITGAGGVIDVRWSNVEFGFVGEGNIDADPIFADAAADDYRVIAGSPCIDAADSSIVPSDVNTDLGHNPRIVDDPDSPDGGPVAGDAVDMGAYEYQVVQCPADTNGDRRVDVDDLVAVILGFGGPSPAADVDGSGLVDINDLVLVIIAWGACRE